MFSQNQTKKWFFGNGAGLNFSGATPTVITGGAITTSVGCASVADAAGNLLFYTDGVTVYNQTHSVMANGSGLLGNDAAQSAMILKKPGSSNLYYIFTVQGNYGSAGLNYSIVDMSLASGNGSVTIKNASLYAGACSEKLTATKHCNGTDYWLLAVCGGSLSSYSLTALGVSTVAVVTPSANINLATIGYGLKGCMKLSPNGRKLALCSYTIIPFSGGTSKAFLYDYDNITGLVSGGVMLLTGNSTPMANNTYYAYGVEFSPDGTKVYYANGGLIQHDLCAASPTAPIVIYSNNDGQTVNYSLKRSLQLAPNGKIYIANSDPSSTTSLFAPTNSLSVINNPNVAGSGSNFNPTGQSLGTYSCQWGLPNFPGSFFEQKPGASFSYTANAETSCLTASFSPSQICSASGYSIMGYQWNFGDPASASANTSFLSNPVHTYPAPGSYTAQLIRSFQCSNDTLYQVVTITSPTISILSPTAACGVNTASVFVSGGTGLYSYSWSPTTQTTSVASFTSAGIFTLYFTDNGGGCSASKTINIINTVLNPSVNTASLACFGNNNGSATVSVSGGSGSYTYTWNGVPQNTTAINGLSAGIFTVSAFDLINLCTINKTFTIAQPSPITSSLGVFGTACVGQSVSIWVNASGGTPPYSYAWSVPSPATNSISVIQNTSGTYNYSAVVVDSHSCMGMASVSVNYIPYPFVASYNSTVCASQSATLLTNGTLSYTWQPGGLNGNNIVVSPAATSIYTLSGDSLGCVSSATVMVTVNPTPTVSANSNYPLCVGQNLLLFAGSNGSSVMWTGPNGFFSGQLSPTISTVSLANAGNYTLAGTNAFGCSSSTILPITINANPSLSVNAKPLICLGESVTLTVSGANNYNWSTGGSGAVIVVTPSSNSNYTVTGTSLPSGCNADKVVTVKVSECLGMGELSNKLDLSVYPNPNNGEFTIESEKGLMLEMFNHLGVQVFAQRVDAGNQNIHLQNVSNGLYLLKANDGTQTRFLRLIINNQ
ncbi:MAG: T9SS type A sorting domain-containing protein [Bacteroidia bacterium]|nr:T9SS type A sorting domain-containing protein [Bacteroidia bacterium]